MSLECLGFVSGISVFLLCSLQYPSVCTKQWINGKNKNLLIKIGKDLKALNEDELFVNGQNRYNYSFVLWHYATSHKISYDCALDNHSQDR